MRDGVKFAELSYEEACGGAAVMAVTAGVGSPVGTTV